MIKDIQSDLNNNILTINILRPKKKNALTIEMYASLSEQILNANKSSSIKTIHIKGSEDSFTAGNDLNDFMQNPPNDETSPVFKFMAALLECDKPIVAEVNGLAIGIGTTLLLHCDLVYASNKAIFQLPFINLGLVPEFASSFILPLLAGHQKASELLMLGEIFDAKTAKEIGIINNYFPENQLSIKVAEILQKLVSKPPTALSHTKRLMKSSNKKLQKVIKEEGELFREQLHGPEVKEAITAFFEKRKPNFK
jgi:enoyl-CoA hydratase/carnithine racemase